ncbi:hypothetical protein ACWDUC_11950 [Streptomyces tricolor]
MTSARARRLAAAAALAALLATAGCGAGDSGEETSPEPTETVSPEETTPDEEETTPEEEETTPDESGTTDDGGESDGEIFLGSDSEESSASDVELPRTRVGEPVQGEVDVEAGAQPPGPLQDVRGEIGGEEVEIVQSCVGETPPCQVVFQYTPTQPGPYDGELTLTLADGSTVTAPIHGEAEDTAPSDTGPTDEPTTEEPTTEEPTTEEPTTDEPLTSETPTPFEDETPVP